MKNFLRIAVLGLSVCIGRFALGATTSQLTGSVTANMNFTLQNPGAVLTNKLVLNQSPVTPFIAGNLTYGTNGIGVGMANQLFIGQWTLTNGALVGTNWLNLYTPTNATVSTTNDLVGNSFSILNIKAIAFQNLGVAAGGVANSETNVAYITIPTGAAAWTNYWGGPYVQCTIPGPPSLANSPNATNTPTLLFWSGGDIGWPVLASTANTIVLTNPVLNGPVIKVNVYIIGSTNQ